MKHLPVHQTGPPFRDEKQQCPPGMDTFLVRRTRGPGNAQTQGTAGLLPSRPPSETISQNANTSNTSLKYLTYICNNQQNFYNACFVKFTQCPGARSCKGKSALRFDSLCAVLPGATEWYCCAIKTASVTSLAFPFTCSNLRS